ncbi:unnamed protein product [Aphanomyces euteiches]|uniref:N-acetyltransferase domain-containing protein n=1 Tax=Aphanomyces euteiches TaxID=100861 RepID=A0A6G0W676_9STRA|nr:hypothetical protein Ae201684_018293 [Aphanomyces euteiches]KAH9082894.1 hypothetical protein Ae201684P_013798 [Aphanomyces euteiches]KAH9151034.1 hypothetical protein AeRB84_006253 [Aphanomyces euteiches]
MATNSTALSWRSGIPLTDLTVFELYDVMELRAKVFIVEQTCIYQDLDGLDKACLHVLGTDSTTAIRAYARVLPPKTKGKYQINPMIGRVVIAPEARGSGQARVLMEKAIDVCRIHWPDLGIDIGAQAHLEKFYSSLGFRKTSEPYDEDGIMHIDMHRTP